MKNNKTQIWILITIMSAFIVLVGVGVNAIEAGPKGPSFDCGKAVGKIEEMICSNEGLPALDRKLAEVYGEAFRKVVNEHPHEREI